MLEALPEDGTRYEIIDGELIVSTQPDLRHQMLVGRIYLALTVWSDQTAAGIAVGAPGVIFAEDQAVAPDIVWVSRARLPLIAGDDGKLHGAPDLIVEHLSPGPTNEQRDRETKLTLYSRRGVQEYWIADWRRRELEIYRREEQALNLVATLHPSDIVRPPLLPGFAVRLGQFFQDLAMLDLDG